MALTSTVPGAASSSVSPERLAVDRELERVGVAVAHVAAAARQALDPLRVVDPRRLPQLDVAAPLTHARAAHAREVGLAARLDVRPAVQQVVPGVPLADPSRVHRADEVGQAVGDGHEDLLRADAVHLGDRRGSAADPRRGRDSPRARASSTTPSRSASIVVERLGQQPARGLGGVESAVVIGVERGRAAAPSRPRRRSADRCPSARSRRRRLAPSPTAGPEASRSASPCCPRRPDRSARSGSAGRRGRAPPSRSRSPRCRT